MRKKSELSCLKNIGPTIEKRLNEIDVYTRSDLERIGPVKAYQWICRNYPDQTIPVCYYLYSLQGALMGVHWDKIPKKMKERLNMEAKRNLMEGRHAAR
jgi:DNA transformation protein